MLAKFCSMQEDRGGIVAYHDFRDPVRRGVRDRIVLATIERVSSNTQLIWYSVNTRDKCDARNDHFGESVIICDEKIGTGRSGGSELNRVRWSNPLTAANFCIALRGFHFECNQFDGAVGKKVEIAFCEDRIARLPRLCERLSNSKVAREQFVATRHHPLPEFDNATRPFGVMFKEVNEEVRVPKDASHGFYQAPPRMRASMSNANKYE